MVIVFPFFKPPKSVLNIQDMVLRSMTMSQVEAEHSDSFPLYIFEMNQLFKTPTGRRIEDLGSFEVAVLEGSSDKVPDACYIALLDLLTGHWRYVLKRTESLAQPMLTNGKQRRYPDVPRYSFTTSLLGKFSRGVKLLSANRRFRISIRRLLSSYTREDPLDTVLDCCSSLEAAFSLSDELRLRISLSVYHVLQRQKKRAFITVYDMYGVRNKFIHGAQFPVVSPEEQQEYIGTVARVLARFVELGKIPDKNTLSNSIREHYAE